MYREAYISLFVLLWVIFAYLLFKKNKHWFISVTGGLVSSIVLVFIVLVLQAMFFPSLKTLDELVAEKIATKRETKASQPVKESEESNIEPKIDEKYRFELTEIFKKEKLGTFQTNKKNENRKENTPLSDDEMHLGACAGEYMWVYLLTKKNYSPTDPRVREAKNMAFWFQGQADSIIGKRSMAISSMTFYDLSSRAEKIGIKSLVMEVLARTANCQPLIMSLKPETARCFELQSDARVGLTYKFVCSWANLQGR